MLDKYQDNLWENIQKLLAYRPTIFDLHIMQGESLDIIEEYEAELKAAIQKFDGVSNFQIPSDIKIFWQAISKLKLIWYEGQYFYKKFAPPLEYATISGRIHIDSLDNIFSPPLEDDDDGPESFQFYDVDHLFDKISARKQVIMRFNKDKPAPSLYYKVAETNNTYKMSIDFTQYMNLLLETCGLVGWQEYFVNDPNFDVDEQRYTIFKQQLQFIFPEVDLSKYEKAR